MTDLEKWRAFLGQWSPEKPTITEVQQLDNGGFAVHRDMDRYTLRGDVPLDWYETVNVGSLEPMLMIVADNGLHDLIINFDKDGKFEQAGR
jgi:hypothetical protein